MPGTILAKRRLRCFFATSKSNVSYSYNDISALKQSTVVVMKSLQDLARQIMRIVM